MTKQEKIDIAVTKAELDFMDSAQGRQQYSELIDKRDRAQAAVTAWQDRKRELTAQLVKLMEAVTRKQAVPHE